MHVTFTTAALQERAQALTKELLATDDVRAVLAKLDKLHLDAAEIRASGDAVLSASQRATHPKYSFEKEWDKDPDRAWEHLHEHPLPSGYEEAFVAVTSLDYSQVAAIQKRAKREARRR